MKQWKDYIDQFGLIRNGDTGDSLRETCTALIGGLKEILNPINCWTVNGWVRHPHPTDQWHADPKEFSRDQWTALMCWFIWLGIPQNIYLKQTWEKQRLFLAQNNDLITWQYVFYIRAFKLWYLYPIICVLDLGLLIDVMIRVVKSYILKDDTADDINTYGTLYVFGMRYPTFFTFLARMTYKLYKGGVEGAWRSYYSRPQAPPMDELWFPTKD